MERDRLLDQPDGYLKIIEQWDHTIPNPDEQDLVDDLWDIGDQE